ncbi:unnamed protein product [Heterosigma akashiwo]
MQQAVSGSLRSWLQMKTPKDLKPPSSARTQLWFRILSKVFSSTRFFSWL